MKKNLLIIICFMTFLSCNSPKNDGERIAEMYNKSVSDFIDEREKTFDGFISDFESYNFSSRVEARNEIESAIDKLVSEYDNDRASADYRTSSRVSAFSGGDSVAPPRNSATSLTLSAIASRYSIASSLFETIPNSFHDDVDCA